MLKHTLFFEKEKLNGILAYASRMNDERQSGEVGYYHLMDTSLALIKESEKIHQRQRAYQKSVAHRNGRFKLWRKGVKRLFV